VSTKRDVHDEIERHIEQRDRLLAAAQRRPEREYDRERIELTLLVEQQRMAQRLTVMEDVLRLFSDEEWLQRATLAEVLELARAALDGTVRRPEEHWLTRVERIAAAV
jgi:hypothetical protein